ncbi:hypothetical protein LPB41_14260 [Thalassospira sp. MA62]|nr:hypothetical protein [Thalassospira sp. MA62]
MTKVIQDRKKVLFKDLAAFRPSNSEYELLPFRFMQWEGIEEDVLITSCVGDHHFLADRDFAALRNRTLDSDGNLYRNLRSRHIVCDQERGPLFEAIAAQNRTRKHHAEEDPALHIFVLTLRCDHRCHYCQVTPQKISACGFDMDAVTAEAALDRVFESQADILTIEFQGGEAGLTFERLEQVVESAERRAAGGPRRSKSSFCDHDNPSCANR